MDKGGFTRETDGNGVVGRVNLVQDVVDPTGRLNNCTSRRLPTRQEQLTYQ